jgi:hypothetical protein
MSRVRVTIEGEYNPFSGYVRTSTGAEFGYFTDDNAIAGASYTVEILPDPIPEIKAGQVWEAGGTRWLVCVSYHEAPTPAPLFLICTAIAPSDGGSAAPNSVEFENSYPERKLILDA